MPEKADSRSQGKEPGYLWNLGRGFGDISPKRFSKVTSTGRRESLILRLGKWLVDGRNFLYLLCQMQGSEKRMTVDLESNCHLEIHALIPKNDFHEVPLLILLVSPFRVLSRCCHRQEVHTIYNQLLLW